jgi:polyhydroxybutyrate depolymerase
VGPRPYEVRVPKRYADAPVPLVVALHPLGSSSAAFVKWWGLEPLADEKTFLLVAPNGIAVSGERFWNATDGCCDFTKTGVDDVAYLKTILDEVTTKYKVDPKRIYFVGFSNGAVMSNRMACEDSRVAAIVSLAGAVWKDEAKCRPPGLVSVLEAHSTDDKVILYDGGGPIRYGGGEYPSAAQTVATWAKRDGCTGTLTPTAESRHFLATAPGADTHLARYAGCPAGIDVALWTIDGAPHVPELTPAWGPAAWEFLAAHPKP